MPSRASPSYPLKKKTCWRRSNVPKESALYSSLRAKLTDVSLSRLETRVALGMTVLSGISCAQTGG